MTGGYASRLPGQPLPGPRELGAALLRLGLQQDQAAPMAPAVDEAELARRLLGAPRG